ncbi:MULTISPECIES: ATP-binding cassette domain-containing protein [unclassified Microbacterium]|uniref:ATP-binding cassette domain-containing protein n=1 Tax=unclassified Microbacterium TaxID=2609290 RepID=UPI00268309E1
MNVTASQAEPLLTMRGVTKRFGAVEALIDVDFTVNAREVVGLVGDNAAGKSTLAKIVAGALAPTDGEIHIAGERVELSSPADAYRHGVATVFQDLAVCENLDVTANVFLGRELRTAKGMMREGDMEAATRQALHDLGASIPSTRAPLWSLSGGQRQAVAIARTLISQPRLVVLDEPTASLSVAQTADVLTHIEHLRDLGLGVIFISHNLGDVQAVSDRIEVLRHGRNNGSFVAQDTEYSDLIAAIIGAPRASRPPRGPGDGLI